MFHWVRNLFKRQENIAPPPDLTAPPAPWVQEFFEDARQESRYTPDATDLFRKPFHYLLSVDETQTGHHQEILLQGARKLEEDGFTLAKYMVLKHDLGIFSHPLIFENDLGYQNPPPMRQIKGEIYEVPPELFFELDKYRSNTVFCYRRLVPVIVPYEHLFFKDRSTAEKVVGMKKKPIFKKDGTPTDRFHKTVVNKSLVHHPALRHGQAWMYISSPSYWMNYLDLNNKHPPVRRYYNDKGPVKEYYRFTNAEYCSDPDDETPF